MASWKNVQYKNGQYRTSEGGGGSSTLSGLDDVTISSASNGQVLKYNSTSSKWVNANETATSALSDLTDVDVDTKSDGDVLTYNESQDRWEAAEPLINDVALTDLTDTSVSSPSDGQVLTYDENENAWVNANPTGGASDLDDLGDVTISSATNGQVLKYDSTTSKWINANESGGGASALNDLTDVDTTGVSDNNVLAYDAGTSKWVPATVSGGNVDDVTVNGTSVVDVNKVAKITSYKELTRAEYDLLPDTKYSDGIMYCISDGFSNPNGFPPLIYSTEEREIGVWVDGKPLYQKTFFYPGPYSGNANHELSLLPGIEFVSFNMLVGKNQDGLGIVIPYVNAATQYSVAVWILADSSKFNLATYGGNTITNLVAVVNYTKITDTAGSGKWATDGGLAKHYSTQEQIIGTWIDGKPLYQKTINVGHNYASPSSNVRALNYDISSLGISNVINYCGTYLGDGFALPYINHTIMYSCYLYVTPSIINIRRGESLTYSDDSYVTLQYTKTTD